MRTSVLDRAEVPDLTGMLPGEIEGAEPCSCGHRLIRKGVDVSYVSHWYWQTHSQTRCTLELPDLVCWCGLRRSQHVSGHRGADEPF